MKLRSGMAFLLMIVLILGGVVYGAYKGWTGERKPVDATYEGLESMLQTRVESANNVLTVARRHIPDTDETLQKVVRDLEDLEGKNASLSQKARGNENLSLDAKALLSLLSGLESVQTDSRDKMYVENYLPQMLSQSEEKTAGAAYNQAAAEFNSRINHTFSGWIARNILRIRPVEEFIAR